MARDLQQLFSEEFFLAEKSRFIQLLQGTHRPGIERLIAWMETKCDFFDAPSSTVFHNNFPHGLLFHSLNVYDAAMAIDEHMFPLGAFEERGYTHENIVIATLLHDLCKANNYKGVEKWLKDETKPAGHQWTTYKGYEVDDQFPLGHGDKSLYIAQSCIRLERCEALAINHHMNFFRPTVELDPYVRYPFKRALETCPLVTVVAQADVFASTMMEKTLDPKTNTFK